MFMFTHTDGRTGKNYSAWAAIVAAIGSEEANSLNHLADLVWTYRPADGGMIVKESPVEADGIVIGTMYELRD